MFFPSAFDVPRPAFRNHPGRVEDLEFLVGRVGMLSVAFFRTAYYITGVPGDELLRGSGTSAPRSCGRPPQNSVCGGRLMRKEVKARAVSVTASSNTPRSSSNKIG